MKVVLSIGNDVFPRSVVNKKDYLATIKKENLSDFSFEIELVISDKSGLNMKTVPTQSEQPKLGGGLPLFEVIRLEGLLKDLFIVN